MNGSSHENPAWHEAVEAAAAEWLVRHDRGLTPPQQDEFLQWLAAKPEHRESFQRHREMWSGLNVLAEWRPEHSAVPNPDLLARPRARRRMRWMAPALLAAAAALVVVVRQVPGLRPVADVAPAATEPLAFEATSYRSEMLPDGSRVDLNRGAHVVVQFSSRERRLLLVQGEAQFTVTKDAARPFVVRAGGADVRAVGTAFNVKLAGENLEVLVTEGTVRVSQPPARQALPTPDNEAPSSPPAFAPVAELTAGQRTVISIAPAIAPPAVVSATREEIARLLEWQPQLLDFESTPLGEVVGVFNRRNATQLVIGDDALRSLPIVASIRSDNVAGFVRLLEATMGVRADRTTPGEIVLRRAQ